ncbi:hypothetical protein EWM64_g9912, partial [Hericium alpestre]
MAQWTAETNSALTLSLVRAPKDKEVLAEDESYEGFHPTFTYPIYGEDEKVYGYSDLVIDLRFASGSLAYYLDIRYSASLNGSVAVDDVRGMLEKFIPPDYYKTEEGFLGRVEEEADTFRPLGDKIYSYTRPAPGRGKGKGTGVALEEGDEDAVVFEAYHLLFDGLFVLLYIEGGSYINEDEESWEFVVLYEKRKRRTTPVVETYHFVGYSSLYPFYCFPDKVRLRLSYQVNSSSSRHMNTKAMAVRSPFTLSFHKLTCHSAGLYNAIYNYVLAQPSIAELTIEDPAEAFEDLRDRNDLKMLLGHEQFMREGFGDT